MYAISQRRAISSVVVVVAVDVRGERPVVPSVCAGSVARTAVSHDTIIPRSRSESRTRVPRHDARGDDDVVIPREASVRIVRGLDRPGQQRVLGRVNGADRGWLERCAPGVADGERAVRRRALLGHLRAKGRVRQVELVRQVLEERCVVGLDVCD